MTDKVSGRHPKISGAARQARVESGLTPERQRAAREVAAIRVLREALAVAVAILGDDRVREECERFSLGEPDLTNNQRRAAEVEASLRGDDWPPTARVAAKVGVTPRAIRMFRSSHEYLRARELAFNTLRSDEIARRLEQDDRAKEDANRVEHKRRSIVQARVLRGQPPEPCGIAGEFRPEDWAWIPDPES